MRFAGHAAVGVVGAVGLSLLVIGCTNQVTESATVDAAPLEFSVRPAPDLSAPVQWSDFPSAPMIDTPSDGTTVPADAPVLFAAAGGASGGPCLVEPESGALIPQNWLRPRFRFLPAAGENLFEIRLHAASEKNDLLLYTTQSTWTLPADLWAELAQHAADQPIEVTVRGAVWAASGLVSGPSAGTSGSFTIAPVSVTGTLSWWSANGGAPAIVAAGVGDEAARPILTPSQVGAGCVGCHAIAPDGQAIGFSASAGTQDGAKAVAGIQALGAVAGQSAQPSWMSAAAGILLEREPQDAPAFSPAHFATGDRVMLSVLPVDGSAEIVWTDLEAASVDQGVGWGVLARGGDLRMAATPAFSHDGTFVVYASATTVTGGVMVTDGDLLTVPWTSRQGGPAQPIAGAHEQTWNEYAPALSPDDQLVSYVRVPAGQSSFANAASELFVVPSGGGTPERLAANDPPACSGSVSPGAGNSGLRFGPDHAAIGDRTLYWMTFSSRRSGSAVSQIYVSAVMLDATESPAKITTMPALYLWSQSPGDGNHSPSWDGEKTPVE